MTGPLIKEVTEPPVIAVVAVLVTESKVVVVVVKIPEVSVRMLPTEVAPWRVLAPPPDTVRLM